MGRLSAAPLSSPLARCSSMTKASPQREVPALYWAPVADFLSQDPEVVLGQLALRDQGRQLDAAQKGAWREEVAILRDSLEGVDGALFLEFAVPRLGSRIDVVLVSRSSIVPIEFKCGESRFSPSAIRQVWDYALDLKNFHSGSQSSPVFPLLVATAARRGDDRWLSPGWDGVRPPRSVDVRRVRTALVEAFASGDGPTIDASSWGRSAYQPTPTIVEAARALYAGVQVGAITRSEAGESNLNVTSLAVETIIEQTRQRREKAIVFVTGVPGAGKTLVGLDVATRRRHAGDGHAVYLSGNQPLVSVLREALTRDAVRRKGAGTRKGHVLQEVKAFIQNVHHFRDEGLRMHDRPPVEHVAIFDEAQRAWTLNKTRHFMARRKGVVDFAQSEPEFLISCLDRHSDWAVVVCLVGGGQEINTGEAGISAWLTAATLSFPTWQIYVSPHLTDTEYATGDWSIARETTTTTLDARLHLQTSMRSFRSELVSGWVKSVLDCQTTEARRQLALVGARYPIVVTRNIGTARRWLRARARASEQVGVLASSGASRLKPHAIDVRVSIDPVHWFLADPDDPRSSHYLEDAATEFQVQGLEVDWACVTWDADLRFGGGGWSHHAFRGKTWTTVHNVDRRRYLLNAYRVLLTRARQGMVIFVPLGEANDPTRAASYYDGTFEYLTQGIGLDTLAAV